MFSLSFHPLSLTGTELEIIVAPFGKELSTEKQVDPRRRVATPAVKHYFSSPSSLFMITPPFLWPQTEAGLTELTVYNPIAEDTGSWEAAGKCKETKGIRERSGSMERFLPNGKEMATGGVLRDKN